MLLIVDLDFTIQLTAHQQIEWIYFVLINKNFANVFLVLNLL